MRISDWSSDVCSSDLASGNPASASVLTDMFVSESGRSETMSLGTATGNFGFVSYDTDDAGEIVEMRQHFNFRLSDKIGTARNADIGLTDSGTVRDRKSTRLNSSH